MATTAKNKKKNDELVAGVILAKVDESILGKYLTLVDLPAEKGDSLTDRIERYAAWVKKNVGEDKVADCDTCKGASSCDLEECPYCGTSGVEVDPKPEPAKKSAAPVVAEPETPKEEPKQAKQEAQPKKRSEAKPGKQAKPEASKPGLATANGAALAETGPSHGSRDIDTSPAAPLDEKALNVAVEAVHRAKGDAIWGLGRAIIATYDHDLWKQRRDPAGNPVHKTFAQFCEAELGITAQHAFKAMDVSIRYPRELVAKIGIAKLGLILRLPEGSDDEKALIDRATEGTPLAEIAKRVHELAGSKPRETGRKHVPTPQRQGKGKSPVPAEPVAPDGSITVALSMGRVKVPLFQKGKLGAEKGRARNMAHKPCGEEVLLNGVIVRYRIDADKDGSWMLIVERVRKD